MANPPPLSPISAAPQEKKKGCGCFGTGCIIVLVLMLIAGGVGLWGGMKMMDYLKGFTSEKGVEIPITEGTDEEYAAVKQKLESFDKATNAGQSSAIQLTAHEINILIAREPDFKNARGRLAVAIENSLISAKVSWPFDEIEGLSAVPQFKGRYFNGDLKLTLTVNDGKLRLNIDEAKVGENTLHSEFLRTFSEGFSQSFNDSPEAERGLSRVRKVAAEGNVLVIDIKPGPGAVPETVTKEPETPN